MLEAGCGLGAWVYLLRKEGFDIIGIDFSLQTIRRLRQAMPGFPVGVGDVTALPYHSAEFDAYVSLGVVEHFEEGPHLPLREAYRVLRPGGLIFLSVPYMNLIRLLSRPWEAIIERSKSNDPSLEFYQYAYTSWEMQEILRTQGFIVLETYPHNLSIFLTAFPPTRVLYNLVYKALKGRIIRWEGNRLVTVVRVGKPRQPKHGNGLASVLERAIEYLRRSTIARTLFSEQILFVARKAETMGLNQASEEVGRISRLE